MKQQNTIGRLLTNAKIKDKKIFPLCALCGVLAAVYPLFGVVLPKLLIGEIMSTAPQIVNVIYIVLGYFIATSVFTFFASYIQGTSFSRLTLLRLSYLRDLSRRMLDMRYPLIEDSTFWEKNNKALNSCNSNDTGVEGIYQKLFNLPPVLLIVVALIIFVGIKSWIILAAILLNIAVTTLVTLRVQQYEYDNKDKVAKGARRAGYYNRTTQNFEYGKDIRLYNLKERVLANFMLEINRYVSAVNLVKRKEFVLGLTSLATLFISDVATYGILIYYCVNGMPLADFSMYLAAILMLTAKSTEGAKEITSILHEKIYVDDMFRFLDEESLEDNTGLKAIKDDTLEIEFKDVCFTYPNTDREVISHLNLTIHKGEKLALVGVNGAGKSTLVKLMTGLYPVSSGEILINGTNLNEFNRLELFSMFSVVFQEVNVLAFSIAENIACTSSNIDYERLNDVIDRAGLREKIDSVGGPDKMMLKIIEEDGTDMSGGERQKLTIARALYKNANMVIMDEPTSALDALAEASVYQDFASIVKGKTAVYVSHRLASTKFCDKIALLDGNKLAEYGTHDELMKLHGEYYEMFVVQGKYYQDEEGGAK